MKVKIENLALCIDCTMVAVNGDYSGIEYMGVLYETRKQQIDKGLEALGGHLVHECREPDEFSHRQCDCCKSRLSGQREFFAILEN